MIAPLAAPSTDGTIAVTMLFTFNEQGLIDTVRADARGRILARAHHRNRLRLRAVIEGQGQQELVRQ